MRNRFRSINRVVAVIVGILIISLLLIQDFLSLVSVQKSNSVTFKDSAAAITKSYSSFLQSTNSGYMQQIRIYTTSPEIKSANRTRQVEYLKSITNQRSKDFSSVAFVDVNGVAWFDNGHVENVSHKDFCKDMLEAKKNQTYGSPVRFSNSPDFIIPICKSYTKENTTGFIMVCVPLSSYQSKVSNISLNGKGYAFLLSRDGDIMAHTNEKQIMKFNILEFDNLGYKGLKEIGADMISKTEKNVGNSWFTDPNGKRFLATYYPVKGSEWSLGLVLSRDDVYAASNKLAVDISIYSALIAFILILTISLFLKRTMRPLKKVDAAIQEIASGEADLTKRISATKRNNEISSLTKGFNSFMDTLQGTMQDLKDSNITLKDAGADLKESSFQTSSAITQINANIENVTAQISKQANSVEETASTVEQIAQNINSLEKMIENQASGVSQASAAVHQMISNITDVNKSIDMVAQTFNELSKKAVRGSEMQQSVNDRISQIEEQSAMLKAANSAIAEISAQTNLLAMNAAIEAAHAGEAGRGFSVVADEIRKLSETSKQQSKTIGEQLKFIQALIIDVGQASSISNKTFASVAQNIKDTNTVVQGIKVAMDEQTEGSIQISKALDQMDGSTTDVRNASEEMTSGNKAILEEIKHLQDVTGSLKSFVSDMDIGAKNINESSSALSAVSMKMQEVIEEIGEKIDCFNT